MSYFLKYTLKVIGFICDLYKKTMGNFTATHCTF